jgi:hypothetical protein
MLIGIIGIISRLSEVRKVEVSASQPRLWGVVVFPLARKTIHSIDSSYIRLVWWPALF